VAGTVLVAGALGELRISDCTLVPGGGLEPDGTPSDAGAASVALDGGSLDRVRIEHAIVGRVELPDESTLEASDSVLDGLGATALAGDASGAVAGPVSSLERCTAIGAVRVRTLELASDSIFTASVNATRVQRGCVRFSYAPFDSSQTPRRYRCQPDMAIEAADPADEARVRAHLVPAFTSLDYGHPAYCQLAARCPVEIRTGASNGAEMGVFNSLLQPQREANLRLRLDEYLPFGLEPGLIYVT
jgi:hypothetical protein